MISPSRPLQNRVDPFGALIAITARGTLMGNRGGRFHHDDQTLGRRRWASRQWICCVLDFKQRHRAVWRQGYTELFFLDEVTALAAGHRPCFECRRAEARRFRAAFAEGNPGAGPAAPELDRKLHGERSEPLNSRPRLASVENLPDGTMVVAGEKAFALRGGHSLPWHPSGYGALCTRPDVNAARLLTPPSIVAALRAGYRPRWHPSAS